MKVSTETLLKEIQAMVSASHQIKHPLAELLFAGKLSKRQLQELVGQQSCIPLYNHKFHGNLYVVCPDHRWRARISEIVYEEGSGKLFANGVSHHELYLRLGEAVGISRQQLWNWPLCAEALAFRVHYEFVCARSFLEGVSMHTLAGESQTSGYVLRVAEALKKHHGLSDEDVLFHTVHEEADNDHANIGVELLDEFARTEEDQHRVRSAVRESLMMRRLRDDGIQRAVLAAA
jgi:pyrroloquinoline quinone (PQQ) biosynthesis protein C